MWTAGEALVAPGPRDESDAGPAGQLADRFRHHGGAAFLPAHRHHDIAIMERVEHGQIALAGNAERVPRSMGQQLIDQNLATRPGIAVRTHAFISE